MRATLVELAEVCGAEPQWMAHTLRTRVNILHGHARQLPRRIYSIHRVNLYTSTSFRVGRMAVTAELDLDEARFMTVVTTNHRLSVFLSQKFTDLHRRM